MCCFNRRMPRVINNNCTVIVPAIPIQTGGCGMAAPAMGNLAPFMPNTSVNPMFENTANNCASTNNVVPSGLVPSGNLSGFTCNANFETVQRVMEQPLQCAPTNIHHHNRVQHMVPCVKTNVHHVHNHHEWIPFEQREINEVVNHNHGTRPSDLQLCNSVR